MSIRLKSRTQCPPNGFRFEQSQTGWKSWIVNPSSQWDFRLLCGDLQRHRLANPQLKLVTDIEMIMDEVDVANAVRVMSIKGGSGYVASDEGPAPPKTTPLLRRLKNVAAGAKTNLEFVVHGGQPVSPELSTSRALICSKCPKNGSGGLERWFTIPAAEFIKGQIEARVKLNLTTPYDDKLGVCEACTCPLKLKVHYPIAVIVDNMLKQAAKDLDPGCWILKEM